MAAAGVAKISIKSIDYFKFKKIVVDGNRDDFAQCSREVRALCDAVQTLAFRDEEFDDVTDRARFEEIISYYKQILAGRRIESLDMRVKNGWWAESKSEGGGVCSANKFKAGALKVTLISKAKDWLERYGSPRIQLDQLEELIEGPGLYVLKHKDRQCFQCVERADKIFATCAEKLKAAFDGTLSEPIASLLIISMAADWEFYFIPVAPSEDDRVLRILENDLILKHDCIWPRGLNHHLHVRSLLEVSEFRKSCLRHRWPPEADVIDKGQLDLGRVRKLVLASAAVEPGPRLKVEEDDEEESRRMSMESGKSQTASRASPVGNGCAVVVLSVESNNMGGFSAMGSVDSKTKTTTKPKPPPSPRTTPRMASNPQHPSSIGKKTSENSSATSRPNSAAKSPAAKTPPSGGSANKPSKLPSKSKATKCDAMSMSLDAAQCQLVLAPSPQPDMTSSVCAPYLGEAAIDKSRTPIIIDETKSNLTRSKSATSLGSRKDSRIGMRKASTTEPGRTSRKETENDKPVDKVAARNRVSSAKETNRSLVTKKSPTSIPGRRPASARNVIEK